MLLEQPMRRSGEVYLSAPGPLGPDDTATSPPENLGSRPEMKIILQVLPRSAIDQVNPMIDVPVANSLETWNPPVPAAFVITDEVIGFGLQPSLARKDRSFCCEREILPALQSDHCSLRRRASAPRVFH